MFAKAVQSLNVAEAKAISSGNTTSVRAVQLLNVLAMLLTPVRDFELSRLTFVRDVQPMKALLRLVRPAQFCKSMSESFSQFINAFVKSLKFAASAAAGIATFSRALQFTKAPFFASPP